MEFALINDNRVEQIIVADEEFIVTIISEWDDVKPVESSVAVGWVWDGDSFKNPLDSVDPVVYPEVVLTSVVVDELSSSKSQVSADYSTMKLPVGAEVTISVELHYMGQLVDTFNEDFAMPMRSTDGMMRYINIEFENGKATFKALMNDSKRWEVNRELINSALPPEAHMDFQGIVITAVE